jgi:hypothetical protein
MENTLKFKYTHANIILSPGCIKNEKLHLEVKKEKQNLCIDDSGDTPDFFDINCICWW